MENLELIHEEKAVLKSGEYIRRNSLSEKEGETKYSDGSQEPKGGRRTDQISALSTVDGSVVGYGGNDG